MHKRTLANKEVRPVEVEQFVQADSLQRTSNYSGSPDFKIPQHKSFGESTL